MTDIFTTDVRVRAHIADVNFRTTYIETTRSVGKEAGMATLKGFSTDANKLQSGQTVTAYITTNDNTGEERSNKLFQGSVEKATQDREGKITVEAYDKRIALHNYYVRYNNEEPLDTYTVLQDVLDDSPFTYTVGRPIEPGVDFRIPTPAEVPGGSTIGENEYGSGRRGEPMRNVLSDLATRLGCRMWADKENVIRIEPYPNPHDRYDLKYITSVNSGDESVDQRKTLVQGSSPVSQAGPAASSIYAETRPQADAISGDDNSDSDNEFTLSNDNVLTQEETERAAASTQFDRELSRNMGDVEVVGNPKPELFDVVRVPSLRAASPDDPFETTLTQEAVANAVESFDSEFAVTGITHVASAQDGYTTTMELGPEPGEALEQIDGLASGFAEVFSDRLDNGQVEIDDALSYVLGYEDEN